MAMTLGDSKIFALNITRMQDGGFVVIDGYRSDYSGDYRGPRFASTSIEEALKYCKRKLDAEHAEAK